MNGATVDLNANIARWLIVADKNTISIFQMKYDKVTWNQMKFKKNQIKLDNPWLKDSVRWPFAKLYN